MQLKLKDKRILFELEQDSRQSLGQLAKKVRLKKETLFYRIKSLEKEEIIKKYLLEIDIYKLGYQFYPVLLRLQNTTPAIEEEIYNYLKTSQYTSWLTFCEGAWDINLTALAKNNFELKIFLDDFLEKYSEYIAEKQIFATSEITYFKRSFWLDKKPNKIVSSGGEFKEEIKNENLKLLRILSENARMPLVEIGKKLRVNPKNIAYQIKRRYPQNHGKKTDNGPG